MNSPSSQIVLKSTSSMSLDERFTMMLQNRQVPLTDVRDTVPQQLTASLKNQRLVQQMANRPSVLSALQNIWSVKQHPFKGSIKARLGRSMLTGGLHDLSRFWGRPRGRGRGRGILMRGALSQRWVATVNHLPPPSPIILKNGSLIDGQHGPYISGGELTRGRGLRGAFRGKAGRGMQFVGRGSAERSARPDCRRLPTQEQLDAQLDEYMSMTKSHLDAQLDAYMAEVDSEDIL